MSNQEIHADNGSEISNVEQIAGDLHKHYHDKVPTSFISLHNVRDLALIHFLWTHRSKVTEEEVERSEAKDSTVQMSFTADEAETSNSIAQYHELSQTSSSKSTYNQDHQSVAIDYAPNYDQKYQADQEQDLDMHHSEQNDYAQEAEENKIDTTESLEIDNDIYESEIHSEFSFDIEEEDFISEDIASEDFGFEDSLDDDELDS